MPLNQAMKVFRCWGMARPRTIQKHYLLATFYSRHTADRVERVVETKSWMERHQDKDRSSDHTAGISQ